MSKFNGISVKMQELFIKLDTDKNGIINQQDDIDNKIKEEAIKNFPRKLGDVK